MAGGNWAISLAAALAFAGAAAPASAQSNAGPIATQPSGAATSDSATTAPQWDDGANNQASPNYPPEAHAKHIAGRVVLRCLVWPSGDLGSCSVLSETPPGWGFAVSALDVSNYLHMKPGTANGVPTAAWVDVPIAFNPG